MDLEGWQDLCCCTSQPVELLPSYLPSPKGDGRFSISVPAVGPKGVHQRCPQCKGCHAYLWHCFQIAHGVDLWSGTYADPGEQAVTVEGWSTKPAILFCLVVQSTYCVCTPSGLGHHKRRGNPHKTLQPISLPCCLNPILPQEVENHPRTSLVSSSAPGMRAAIALSNDSEQRGEKKGKNSRRAGSLCI